MHPSPDTPVTKLVHDTRASYKRFLLNNIYAMSTPCYNAFLYFLLYMSFGVEMKIWLHVLMVMCFACALIYAAMLVTSNTTMLIKTTDKALHDYTKTVIADKFTEN